jgi:hypothetical protein
VAISRLALHLLSLLSQYSLKKLLPMPIDEGRTMSVASYLTNKLSGPLVTVIVFTVSSSLGGFYLVDSGSNAGADEPSLVTATRVAGSVKTSNDNLKDWTNADAIAKRQKLEQVLQTVRTGYQKINNEVRNYTCTMTKRTRVDGVLDEPQHLIAKVRHLPREQDSQSNDSVNLYLKFTGPASVRGREVLYPSGADNDLMLVRRGGNRLAFLTVELEPTSPIAMRGTLHPITDFGIKRLIERLIECAEKELTSEHCSIKVDEQATFDEKPCTLIEVCNDKKREECDFHLARVFIDHHLQFPVRFEAYDWPSTENGDPNLIEEYTYRDLKFNVELTDDDFDRKNPEYRFSKRD